MNKDFRKSLKGLSRQQVKKLDENLIKILKQLKRIDKNRYKSMWKAILATLLFSFNAYATTIQWDHDCSDTDGFYVYNFDNFDSNPQRQASVNCPTTQANVFLPGWYVVTAYNENGESLRSNSIELAQYYFNHIKIEYDENGLVIYRGEHANSNAASDDPNWVIKRYYYSNSQLVEIKIQITSWDNRALGW